MPMDWGLARDYAARDVHPEGTLVTEDQWLAATDPEPLLDHLRRKASDRKLRLFAIACCRRVDELLANTPGLTALEFAELHVDQGVVRRKGRPALEKQARRASREAINKQVIEFPMVAERGKCPDIACALSAAAATINTDPQNAAGNAYGYACYAAAWDELVRCGSEISHSDSDIYRTFQRSELAQQAILFRDIFSNPFRPIAAAQSWLKGNDGAAVKVAASLYNEGAFDRLPLLADALEDTGCTDAELLGHLRAPGPHVRGCWAVDLVLGKE
jgi:hypothetical protein